ncbi:bifunctional enoyl-CoA hydratase/phosphate acetyltransferase [Acidithiobacillus caldus]|uniref:Phosphate acetyltransferase n=2 Tax=Acidithiobacillus caldus TaxID=33059 RepID=A0A059ZU95_ACICK|nr:bifunctional enoyl-CoA hydratase/phosphate acetyltransferase [Acidithiobacillus caldus]AIA55170.1 Phosphate acetyltransferase [Acidithiobacillus caldus ATCC 51756]MBU2729400.1 bifunctional enoyl-CoA hydratase/phosphate acetyltransferase [Acidithiobacillus caldus]MBU2745406.1 bifunctional enoyl-CoA hydratase/phosphate acetyltransferase [Acidithiobacillus caldus]MBU2780669.1 bifunctional enoyl-CoA hydratase/phosphate acetyltransferase [Acidithiobacillus caldus]
MAFAHFDELLQRVEPLGAIPVAVVDAGEEFVLRGACEAKSRHIIDPILIGDSEHIRGLLRALGADSGQCPSFQIVHSDSAEQAAEKGVDLVLQRAAVALMKGHIHSDAFLHPILAKLRGNGRLSHVFVCELQSYHKLLLITDAAINITPDLMTKAAIIANAAAIARVLEVETPKVAALSAVEVVNPAIPSTVDAACLAKMADRGQIAGVLVDGPLAFDNAISAQSARIKGIHSPVSGDVDILLVPDLVSGNILAKDLEYLGGATLGGIVYGARVPIILTSRADPARARLVSAALAALVHHTQEPARG